MDSTVNAEKEKLISSSKVSHIPKRTTQCEKITQYEKSNYQHSQYYELSEKDFYPPADERVLRSGVNDILNGDNFADFTESFFEHCEEEEIYDD